MVNWEKVGRPPRAARSALSFEVIAIGGIELADRDGLDAVTMRKVADRIGAGAMSLYRYVDSRDDLIDLMVDRVSAEAVAAPPTGDWRADLTAMALTIRQIALRHPWLARQVPTADAFGPGTIAMTESHLSLLDGHGFDIDQMLDIWRTVLAFVQGYAHAEARRLEAGRRGGARDAGPEAAAAPSYLDRVAESGGYPLTSRALRGSGGRAEPERAFDRRLGFLLDGLAGTFFAGPR
jgi:AcrR family transcriptional regulator